MKKLVLYNSEGPVITLYKLTFFDKINGLDHDWEFQFNGAKFNHKVNKSVVLHFLFNDFDIEHEGVFYNWKSLSKDGKPEDSVINKFLDIDEHYVIRKRCSDNIKKLNLDLSLDDLEFRLAYLLIFDNLIKKISTLEERIDKLECNNI